MKEGRFSIPSHPFFVAVVPLCCVLLIAGFRDVSLFAFFGSSLEVGTVASLLLFICCLTLPLFFEHRRNRVVFAVFISVLFVCFQLAFGRFAPLVPEMSTRSPLFATVLAASSEHVSSFEYAVLGTGPHSFTKSWHEYRPRILNNTDWWNKTPSQPYSVMLLVAIEYGMLGVISFLFVPIALVVFEYMHRHTRTYVRGALLGGAVVGFCVLCLYPVSTPVVMAILFLSGLTAAEIPAASRFEIKVQSPLGLSIVTLLVCACLASAYILIRESVAGRLFLSGESLVTSTTADAADRLALAADFWPTPEYFSEAARVELLAALQRVQSDTDAGRAPDLDALQKSAQAAKVLLDTAVNLNPKRFETWLARAGFYADLETLGFADVSEMRQEAFVQAISFAPTAADVRYHAARFAYRSGNRDLAQSLLTEALALKSDYPDARALFNQLGQ